MPRKKVSNPPKNLTAQLLLGLVSVAFVLLVGFTIHKNLYQQTEQTVQPNPVEQKIEAAQPETVQPAPREPEVLPAQFSLTVPFTPQAPTANWDELHNEACEEASVIMANNYFSGAQELTPNIVEAEITKLTNWQKQNLGYYLSIDTEETAQMIEQVYGLQTEIKEISEQTIKQALKENKLVILAANGQLLQNPYFKPPGPIYHMLVITGWNENGFITNDPGTKRGLNYKYSYDILYAASGNWSHKNHKINLEDKKIIVVNK